jgi:uncharacterized protein YkwD
VLAAAALAVVAISPPVTDRLGYEPPFGIGDVFDREPSSMGFQLFPGGPTITTYEAPLYADDDPWKEWLAPESACPGGERIEGSRAEQVETMLCLLNFARAREELTPLKHSRLLSRTSATKASEIVRCNEFAHDPCGRPANQVAVAAGYEGAFGENMYAAEGKFVSPRVAVDRWLNSPGHRENLFRPQWKTVGIAIHRNADFGPFDQGVIWVNQFGDN